MSTEFAKMLRETLDKMSKRIQMANWNADSDPKFMQKMKDMADLDDM